MGHTAGYGPMICPLLDDVELAGSGAGVGRYASAVRRLALPCGRQYADRLRPGREDDLFRHLDEIHRRIAQGGLSPEGHARSFDSARHLLARITARSRLSNAPLAVEGITEPLPWPVVSSAYGPTRHVCILGKAMLQEVLQKKGSETCSPSPACRGAEVLEVGDRSCRAPMP